MGVRIRRGKGRPFRRWDVALRKNLQLSFRHGRLSQQLLQQLLIQHQTRISGCFISTADRKFEILGLTTIAEQEEALA